MLTASLGFPFNPWGTHMFGDDSDDLGNVAVAVCVIVLLLAGMVFLANLGSSPIQTASQAPIGIDRTVPNIVPSLPR